MNYGHGVSVSDGQEKYAGIHSVTARKHTPSPLSSMLSDDDGSTYIPETQYPAADKPAAKQDLYVDSRLTDWKIMTHELYGGTPPESPMAVPSDLAFSKQNSGTPGNETSSLKLQSKTSGSKKSESQSTEKKTSVARSSSKRPSYAALNEYPEARGRVQARHVNGVWYPATITEYLHGDSHAYIVWDDTNPNSKVPISLGNIRPLEEADIKSSSNTKSSQRKSDAISNANNRSEDNSESTAEAAKATAGVKTTTKDTVVYGRKNPPPIGVELCGCHAHLRRFYKLVVKSIDDGVAHVEYEDGSTDWLPCSSIKPAGSVPTAKVLKNETYGTPSVDTAQHSEKHSKPTNMKEASTHSKTLPKQPTSHKSSYPKVPEGKKEKHVSLTSSVAETPKVKGSSTRKNRKASHHTPQTPHSRSSGKTRHRSHTPTRELLPADSVDSSTRKRKLKPETNEHTFAWPGAVPKSSSSSSDKHRKPESADLKKLRHAVTSPLRLQQPHPTATIHPPTAIPPQDNPPPSGTDRPDHAPTLPPWSIPPLYPSPHASHPSPPYPYYPSNPSTAHYPWPPGNIHGVYPPTYGLLPQQQHQLQIQQQQIQQQQIQQQQIPFLNPVYYETVESAEYTVEHYGVTPGRLLYFQQPQQEQQSGSSIAHALNRSSPDGRTESRLGVLLHIGVLRPEVGQHPTLPGTVAVMRPVETGSFVVHGSVRLPYAVPAPCATPVVVPLEQVEREVRPITIRREQLTHTYFLKK